MPERGPFGPRSTNPVISAQHNVVIKKKQKEKADSEDNL
jgi:hypothetical protein